MQYRELGRTGLRLSEIGLGCEAFATADQAFTAEMFEVALAAGVNCMDLYSPNPQMRSQIGRVLRGRREQFILQAHLCTIWQDEQYKRTRDLAEVKASFADLLERLETDYIDIGMIHYVDSLSEWHALANGPIMAYAQELKQAGVIKSIGLSSHNPAAALAAVKSGLIEVLMFSINPCYDLLPANEDVEQLWADASYARPLLNMDPERAKLYETCQRLGVGITVMKAFGGGDLLSEESPAGKSLTIPQCIHYALTRPGVSSVMTGARNVEQLEASLAYVQAPAAARDYATALATFPKISWQGHCMYCGHCAPCPQGIEIASVTKFLSLAQAQGELPETVREHYAALNSKASACTACGACETRCPFQVPVRQKMQQAVQVFGC